LINRREGLINSIASFAILRGIVRQVPDLALAIAAFLRIGANDTLHFGFVMVHRTGLLDLPLSHLWILYIFLLTVIIDRILQLNLETGL